MYIPGQINLTRYLVGLLFVLIGFSLQEGKCFASVESPEILILNSYHPRYKWSDDVVNGVESNILAKFPRARIHMEYMDTKLNSSDTYVSELKDFYREKLKTRVFDLVVATDDFAINFAIENRSELFKGVPIVFGGANDYGQKLAAGSNLTGVFEHSDFKGTLGLILKLQSGIRKIYVINDTTLTGQKVSKDFKRVSQSYTSRIEFVELKDVPLDQLAEEVSRIPEGSAILMLAYLRDNQGNFYPPQVTASTLSEVSKVPIYSTWDFYFPYGILGGVLTSGYLHGEAVADLANEVLDGAAADSLAVKLNGGNRVFIDHDQYARYGLQLSDLPRNAIVKNITYNNHKKVLALLSYSADNAWNNSILTGIRESIDSSEHDVQIFVEYMDTKRYSSKAYLHQLAKIYKEKYKQIDIDLIITADDYAFRFAEQNRGHMLPDSPIVFCGVSYLENFELVNQRNITGVMEYYDIEETIKFGLELFPGTKKIVVINDESTTGKTNEKNLAIAKESLPEDLVIESPKNLAMVEVQEMVSDLDETSLILLMSFTTDKNNQRFSYENSIRLIRDRASRPILGFWDFYLGNGIAAGAITSGVVQGRVAGQLGNMILSGKEASQIPIVRNNPVQKTIDFQEVTRFNWDETAVGFNTRVLNRSYNFYEDKRVIYTVLITVAILLLVVVALVVRVVLQRKLNRKLTEIAETDDLTGAKSRNHLMKFLEEAVPQSFNEKTPLTACYIDLDHLKLVNDNYGHDSGDLYIVYVVNTIKKHIRTSDLLARIGGDEFVAVLSGCPKDTAQKICERINEDLLQLIKQENIPFDMSVSYGVAVLNVEQPQTPSDLLGQADRELYLHKEAKRGG